MRRRLFARLILFVVSMGFKKFELYDFVFLMHDEILVLLNHRIVHVDEHLFIYLRETQSPKAAAWRQML